MTFAANLEKCGDNILKILVASNSISYEIRRFLKPVGTRPCIMYGICKVRKDIIDDCSSFWPILSAISTRTYKLAKFLAPILKFLTSNEYTIFIKEIDEQNFEMLWEV